METSTFVNLGNLMGVKMLYVTPSLNKMVALLEKFPEARAVVKAGVSSAPEVWGTVYVVQAQAAETNVDSTRTLRMMVLQSQED